MRVELEVERHRLRMTFEADTGDPVDVPGRPRMDRNELNVHLPPEWSSGRTHPDILGLVALASVQPWTESRLKLTWPVSPDFAEVIAEAFKIEIGPVDRSLAPRTAPAGAVPGLSFSGGVDSMSLSALLPDDTKLYFSERVDPPKGADTLYNKSAAVATCTEISKRGRFLRQIPWDVEYLRKPTGVPADLAFSIPMLLMADVDRLDALGFGTTAEAAYGIGRDGFLDYARRNVFRRWQSATATVGMPLLNGVAGVSEVGTLSITKAAPDGALAQSCLRGRPGRPCGRCWKCLRKTLLDSALTGQWPDDAWLAHALSANEPMTFLTKFPIKYECVLTYALGQYTGNHPVLSTLRRRVRGDTLDMTLLKRYYPPALEIVPEKYRDGVRARLDRYLGPMSDAEQRNFESWSTEEVTTPPFRKLAEEFQRAVADFSQAAARAR